MSIIKYKFVNDHIRHCILILLWHHAHMKCFLTLPEKMQLKMAVHM